VLSNKDIQIKPLEDRIDREVTERQRV